MYGHQSGPLSDRLLQHLFDPCGHAALPGVAQVFPLSDPCKGSGGGHAWADIGFISTAASPGPSWSSMRYVRYVSYSTQINTYQLFGNIKHDLMFSSINLFNINLYVPNVRGYLLIFRYIF